MNGSTVPLASMSSVGPVGPPRIETVTSNSPSLDDGLSTRTNPLTLRRPVEGAGLERVDAAGRGAVVVGRVDRWLAAALHVEVVVLGRRHLSIGGDAQRAPAGRDHEVVDHSPVGRVHGELVVEHVAAGPEHGRDRAAGDRPEICAGDAFDPLVVEVRVGVERRLVRKAARVAAGGGSHHRGAEARDGREHRATRIALAGVGVGPRRTERRREVPADVNSTPAPRCTLP